MRGEVEIWDGDKLIHKESNLLVNGAGEAIADMLTVSPSLSGIASASALLDTSNYTIQAISFGKDASAYHENAHVMNSRRNLWPTSTPSSTDQDAINSYYELEIFSTPTISPPPQFAGIASSVAHVVRLDDNSTSANGYMSITLTAENATTGPNWSVSGGQDAWWCQSCYLKFPVTAASINPHTTTTNARHPRTHFGLSIYGEGRDLGVAAGNGNLGHSRLGTVVDWGDTGEVIPYSPSSINLSYQNAANPANSDGGGARSEASGYSINNWQQNGGAVHVGDGWYRIWAAGLAPVSGVSSISTTLYPASFENSPVGEGTASLYAFGFQMELGRWPTEVQFNTDNFKFNNWDLSGSALNRNHVPGAPTDNGTVRVVPPYGTSSYVPTNYLSSPPNPDSTRVEDGDTALLDLSSDILRNFNMGQNLNVIPYRKNPGGTYGLGNINGSQKLIAHNVLEGEDLTTWLQDYAAGYGPHKNASGMDSFGPQAYYLGCFPEGSSTGGSNFALVSSLDNSAAYPINYVPSSSPYFVSGTYNSIVNEASSMDVSGFVGKVYDSNNNTVGTVPNPNLLFYTNDPANSPALSLPADMTGDYWSADPDLVSDFSLVEETNPFGGTHSINFSAAPAASVDYWPYLAARLNSQIVTAGALPGRPREAKASDRMAFTWYVKRPPVVQSNGNATSSFFINIYDPGTPNVGNIMYFNYEKGYHEEGSGIPTYHTGGSGIYGSIVEDVGNEWYRCGGVLSGLGSGFEGGTVEGDDWGNYIYIGGTGYGGTYADTADQNLFIYAPQVEQWPLSTDISATPYQEVAAASATIAEQNGVGGLNVSGGIDTTNSGTVEYSIIVGSGDVGYSNLYGGIYNMGLWTIDTEASRLAGNTAPYSFGPLDNPRKYKLFATKHLTKNLGFIEDSGGHPGCLSYNDLTIKWRIHFT